MNHLTNGRMLQRAQELLTINQPQAATTYLEALLLREPRNHDVMFELGRIAMRVGDLNRARALGRRITGLAAPARHALGHLLIANALREGGRHREASAEYAKVEALEPGLPEVLCNWGGSLVELAEHDAAVSLLERAAQALPQEAAIRLNLGMALSGARRLPEAAVQLREAVRLNGGLARAWIILGGVLLDLMQDPEAAQCFEEAIARLEDKGEKGVAQYNLALVLIRQGRRRDALVMLAQSVENAPMLRLAHGAMLHQAQWVCHWDLVAFQAPGVLRLIRDDGDMVVEPFSALSIPGATARDHALAGRAYARRIFPAQPQVLVPRGHRWDDGRQRLRVGFLCADFRDHPTAYLTVGLLEQLDRTLIEPVAITYGDERPSAMRSRALAACEGHLELNPALAVSELAAARAIAALELDVVLDLMCYTSGTRSGLLAHRPAPLVGHYLIYQGSAASPVFDFTLLDEVVCPPGEEAGFTEKVLHFRESFFPPTPAGEETAVPTRAEEGLPEQGIVFASMNQAFKISRDSFSAWCEVLRRVPGSVLWLLALPAETEAALRGVMVQEGLEPSRLVVARRVSQAAHRARLRLADVGLDTWPYGSHTTAMDLVAAQVPLVAWLGDTQPARVSASILHAAGLPGLVAGDRDAFVDAAVRLATQPEALEAARAVLAGTCAPARLAERQGEHARELSALLVAAAAEVRGG